MQHLISSSTITIIFYMELKIKVIIRKLLFLENVVLLCHSVSTAEGGTTALVPKELDWCPGVSSGHEVGVLSCGGVHRT